MTVIMAALAVAGIAVPYDSRYQAVQRLSTRRPTLGLTRAGRWRGY